jgi:hypothetical protein
VIAHQSDHKGDHRFKLSGLKKELELQKVTTEVTINPGFNKKGVKPYGLTP